MEGEQKKENKKRRNRNRKITLKQFAWGQQFVGFSLASLVWLGTVIKQLLIAKLGSRRWHNLLACPTA